MRRVPHSASTSLSMTEGEAGNFPGNSAPRSIRRLDFDDANLFDGVVGPEGNQELPVQFHLQSPAGIVGLRTITGQLGVGPQLCQKTEQRPTRGRATAQKEFDRFVVEDNLPRAAHRPAASNSLCNRRTWLRLIFLPSSILRMRAPSLARCAGSLARTKCFRYAAAKIRFASLIRSMDCLIFSVVIAGMINQRARNARQPSTDRRRSRVRRDTAHRFPRNPAPRFAPNRRWQFNLGHYHFLAFADLWYESESDGRNSQVL